MNRPKVVVRAVASADGKVMSAPCAIEEWLEFTHRPDAMLLDHLDLPGGEEREPWPLPAFRGESQHLYQDFLPNAVIDRPEHRGWFAVIDTRGRERWAFKENQEHWHLLILVTRRTPPKYLAYLRRENIPYLVVGDKEVDFRQAVEKLGALLEVACILTTAGGELGGALLQADVIDDVNIEFCSTIKGGAKSPGLFVSPEPASPENPVRLRLVSAQVQAEGRVWHRYEVLREPRFVAEGALPVAPPRPAAVQPRPADAKTEASLPRLELPAPDTRGRVPLETALASRRSVRSFTAQELALEQIGQLLWAAQGITDPAKGLRAAPSAGARYPLALYVCRADGVWRYQPQEHALTGHLTQDVRYRLDAAAEGQDLVSEAPCTFAISAVLDRIERAYGEERGRNRLLPLECGHAAENLLLQSIALGLGGVPVAAFDDAAVKEVLALPAGEEPLYLLVVGYPA